MTDKWRTRAKNLPSDTYLASISLSITRHYAYDPVRNDLSENFAAQTNESDDVRQRAEYLEEFLDVLRQRFKRHWRHRNRKLSPISF